jgi:hypothetical protein
MKSSGLSAWFKAGYEAGGADSRPAAGVIVDTAVSYIALPVSYN